MLSPRWRKVIRDLANYKTRTAIVVISIAVGVFAIGTIATSREILGRDLNGAYEAINPPSFIVFSQPFDEDLLNVVRKMNGVADADARRRVGARVRTTSNDWQPLFLFAPRDFNHIRVNQVQPEQGAWPPPFRGILIERASLVQLKLRIGDTILVEMPDGKQREMRIAGTTHDLFQPPSQFSGNYYGYITLDTLEWLGETRDFSDLHVRVSENRLDQAHVQDVANEARDKVEKSGRTVFNVFVPTPGKHPADEQVEPLLLILGFLGVLALALSGFLVVNTITALLAQQIRQIGVMKAIGAQTKQLVGMYLGAVTIFGALALLIAVPLGALGASWFTNFVASMINFDIRSFSIPLPVLLLEIVVALLVPILAALWPVFSGTRITIREAIASYGLGKGHFGKNWIDRFLERVRGLPRPLLLSLRNTFRRKARLALTLSTLVLGAAIFIAVFSVRDSLLKTLDVSLNYWNYDIDVDFDRAYRMEQIEREALQVPGVTNAESWVFYRTFRVRPDDTESDNLLLVGPRAGTTLIRPVLISGRWLQPEDKNAIVVNTDFTQDEPDVRVGEDIVLKVDGKDRTFRVVGLVQGVLTGPIAYLNSSFLAETLGQVGRASGVQVVTNDRSPAVQKQIAEALEAHYEKMGLHVSGTSTNSQLRERVEFQFNLIIIFLMIMAVLIAIVGGLGLMATMSINVIERSREIGVLRAIGASNGSVLRIFMAEGLLIGVLSWLIGVVLALPISILMSNAIGMAFLQQPLNFRFSLGGMALWLAIVLVLATAASLWPSWNAVRLSVREILAYE